MINLDDKYTYRVTRNQPQPAGQRKASQVIDVCILFFQTK